MTTLRQLPLSSLILDIDNFRTRHQDDEAGAIATIISAAEKKILNLAKDIAKTGLSLANNIVVVESVNSPGIYTVLEGNRRITCLKLIDNPMRIPSSNPQLRKEFYALANIVDANWRTQNLNSINCLVCSEQEALKEVERRHATGQEGVGLEDWEAMARLRLKKRQKEKEASPSSVPILEIVESFISAESSFDNAQRQKLFLTYPISTFDRWFLPLVSHLQTTAEQLAIDYPTHPRKQGIDKLLLHIADGKTVTSRTHEKVDDHILPALASVYFPDPPASAASTSSAAKTQPNQVFAAAGQSGSGTVAATKPLQARGNTPSIENANKFNQVIKGFSARGSASPKVQTLLKEIKHLGIKKNPNAFAMLLRSIIDISVRSYCEKYAIPTTVTANSGQQKDIDLTKLCNAVERHLVGQQKESERLFNGTRNLFSSPSSPLSITSMNQIVHSRHSTMSALHIPEDLLNWGPFLIAVHKYL